MHSAFFADENDIHARATIFLIDAPRSTLFTTDEELDRAKRLLKSYEAGDYSIPEEELWKAKKSTSLIEIITPASEDDHTLRRHLIHSLTRLMCL